MHQRSSSGTTRIAIPASHSKSPDAERSTERQSAKQYGSSSSRPLLWLGQNSKRRGHWADGSSSSLGGTAGQGRQQFRIRIARRHFGILALAVTALYLMFTRSSFSTWGSAGSSHNLALKSSNIHNSAPSPRALARSKAIDGSKLRTLKLIEEAAGYIDEDEIEAREADRLPPVYNPNAPPSLAFLPDGKSKPRPKVSSAEVEAARLATLAPAHQLDKAYCPDQPDGCKFLFAAWLGEQETKAQMHLYQLGLLAVALNRTLILPNVSKSRMMSCATQPFDFYYAADSLEQMRIPTMSFAKFAEWSSLRRPVPSAQIVAIGNSKTIYALGALEVEAASDPTLVPSSTKRKLCLEAPRTYLNFSSYSPLSVYPPISWYKAADSRSHFGESLINTLKSDIVLSRSVRKPVDAPSGGENILSLISPDVLVFNYELRYPILSHEHIQNLALHTPGGEMSHPNIRSLQPFSHFPYSDVWTSLADQLSASLSPFVAVHWRQETLPTASIAQCGEALIDELVRLTSEQYTDIKTIYLATDYPLEDLESGKDGATAHSGTFGKLLTEEHHKSMQNFLRLFRQRLTLERGVRLTTLVKEQPNLVCPEELQSYFQASNPGLRKSQPETAIDLAELDAGLLGIIDKKVAMQAEVFLTGQVSGSRDSLGFVCAKDSSFTKQISEARRAKRMEEGERSEGILRSKLKAKTCSF